MCVCVCVRERGLYSVDTYTFETFQFFISFLSLLRPIRERRKARITRAESTLRCPSSPSPLFRDLICGQHTFEKDDASSSVVLPAPPVFRGRVWCSSVSAFSFRLWRGRRLRSRILSLSSRWWCLDPPHKRRERERTLSRDTKSLSSSSSRFVERRDALLLLRQSVKKRERRATRRKRRHDGETRASLCMTN